MPLLRESPAKGGFSGAGPVPEKLFPTAAIGVRILKMNNDTPVSLVFF
jgi:hypothetical protein